VDATFLSTSWNTRSPCAHPEAVPRHGGDRVALAEPGNVAGREILGFTGRPSAEAQEDTGKVNKANSK